jgi:DNA methylase
MNPTPYYQDDLVTLYHGNNEDVLPTLQPVDHVITDPPYSEHTHKSVRSAKMMANDRGGLYGSDVRRTVTLGFDSLTPELRLFCAQQFARLATRWVLVFSDVESDHLWREDLTASGLDYVRTGAWVKVGSTPQFSGDRPATGFEAVTIAHPKGKKRWNGGGKHALWSVPIVLNRSGSDPRWHTTQKPLALMETLVDQFTDPGDTILDAFGGSGTTALAAQRMGRKCIIIEKQEEHCESIVERLRLETPRLFANEVRSSATEQAFDFGDIA